MDARPAGRAGSGGARMTLVVIDAVGLTPRALQHMPRLSKLGADGFQARLDPIAPGGHLLRPGDVAHRADADRARHRRQRLVLPRPRRGLPLAPAQQARAGREGLGDRPPREARLPRREPLLVVRDGRVDRPDGHAAADLPRRRRASRPDCYTYPAAAARQPDRPARRVPAVPVLGPDGEHQVDASGSPTRRKIVLDNEPLDLLLVYLPHLDYDHQRFGPDGAGGGQGRAELDEVAGRPDRPRARARRPGRRAERVRHHRRRAARSRSTARCAAPGC